MEYKGKQLNCKLTINQYNQVLDCCEMLGVTKSDFVRSAISNYIVQTYAQQILTKIYKELKEVELKSASDEELLQIKVLLDALNNLTTN